MEQKIKALLARIVHPESGRNIVESGMVEHIRIFAALVRFARHSVRPETQSSDSLKTELNLCAVSSDISGARRLIPY